MSGNVGALSGPQCSLPAPPFKTVILWFRRDLRVSDNPALIAAVQAATNVVCNLAALYFCLLLGLAHASLFEDSFFCFYNLFTDATYCAE